MKKNKFGICLFFLVIALQGELSAEPHQSAESWKKDPRFKTGVLRNFTPPSVSPDSVNVLVGEPIFIVAGIERDITIDPREKKDREKIRFKVISGNGEFSEFNSPTKKKRGNNGDAERFGAWFHLVLSVGRGKGICGKG